MNPFGPTVVDTELLEGGTVANDEARLLLPIPLSKHVMLAPGTGQ